MTSQPPQGPYGPPSGQQYGPPQGPPQSPYGYPGAQQQAGNGLAIAALVCGIVGLFLFGVILGVLSIIFGGVGVSRANKGAKHKGMAIAGLVLGVLDIILFIVYLAVWDNGIAIG